jgi:hypothetical protein
MKEEILDNSCLEHMQSKIQAEHDRLGHKLGWRLLTCPSTNLRTAPCVLVTLNPGGRSFEAPSVQVEGGSAYELESWKEKPAGEEKLQIQVRRMLEVAGFKPAEVLSGYLVPFRSPDWKTLSNKKESIKFGITIWQEILKNSPARIIFAFGKDTGEHVAGVLDQKDRRQVRAEWGDLTIDLYRTTNGTKLIVLPHLSRYSLFGRTNSESAFQKVLALAKSA